MTTPLAFFSYTRLDDEAYGLTELRGQLQTRVRSILGDTHFRIFQDVDGIKTGEDWRERLDGAVRDAALFIAVLTPAFLRSEPCRDELTKFLRIESERGRGLGELVLPFYMVTTPLLEDPGRDPTDELAKTLRARQRFDWREVRDLTPSDTKYRERLHTLAEDVAEIVDRGTRAKIQASTAASASVSATGTISQTTISTNSAHLAEAATPFAPAVLKTPPAPYPDLHIFRDTLRDGTPGPEMVVIPAGKFMMGSPPEERGRSSDEGPQHWVSVPRFAMGRYAVTFEEYDRFCSATGARNPKDRGWGRGRRPVIFVSWNDARAFCEWLSTQAGRPYRLPTEAEWEYACRAGTKSRYSFGDELHIKHANVAAGVFSSVIAAVFTGRAHEVGSYPANPWKLFDMEGNVLEWCEDSWHESYAGAPEDGSTWKGKESGPRVLRGGSFAGDRDLARCAVRSGHTPGRRLNYIGFRVVCSSPSRNR